MCSAPVRVIKHAMEINFVPLVFVHMYIQCSVPVHSACSIAQCSMQCMLNVKICSSGMYTGTQYLKYTH